MSTSINPAGATFFFAGVSQYFKTINALDQYATGRLPSVVWRRIYQDTGMAPCPLLAP